MRFCPICTQRYFQELNRCPQCTVLLMDEVDDDQGPPVPEDLDVAWSLSHVAAEVNRLCHLLAEQGISASVAERDLVFPWPRWKEMSASLSFPNDVRNVRLLVKTEQVEQAQRIIEETTPEPPHDDEDFEELVDEPAEAEWRYEPDQEIGDMGGPPLADR